MYYSGMNTMPVSTSLWFKEQKQAKRFSVRNLLILFFLLSCFSPATHTVETRVQMSEQSVTLNIPGQPASDISESINL